MQFSSNSKHYRHVDVSVNASTLAIRPLRKDDWLTIVELFGERGACGGCWCMWWRVPSGGKTWEQTKGQKNRNSLQRLVEAGKVHAVIAFSDDHPVGWCSFGPRMTFPRLETVRALKRNWSEGTWSIICFYILPRWRGHRVATKLLEAATAQSFALGALEVEGYPVVSKKPQTRMPAAFAWTGVPSLFHTLGYREALLPEMSRPIFLKECPTSPEGIGSVAKNLMDQNEV